MSRPPPTAAGSGSWADASSPDAERRKAKASASGRVNSSGPSDQWSAFESPENWRFSPASRVAFALLQDPEVAFQNDQRIEIDAREAGATGPRLVLGLPR